MKQVTLGMLFGLLVFGIPAFVYIMRTGGL
jgi:hypothetical protein